jgi:citrate lyase subunit beta/citryl-CoA lyase
VPVNVPKFVDRAHTRGADVIQLDLEDSVPSSEKDSARKLIENAAAKVRQFGADVVVRINRPLSAAVRDIERSICPNVDAIAVTKTEGSAHVRLLDELVTECEIRRGMPQGRTKFITMIETARAFAQLDEIALSSERVIAMNIGGEDFALDCGMQPDENVLLHPKQHMIIAARAAGVMPLGFIGSVSDFHDLEIFRTMVRRSRRFGFDGAACIHPGQVKIVNEEYTPDAQEIGYAEKVIKLNEDASAAGRASFQIDGKMIDIPVVERAVRLLARYHTIKAREAKMNVASGLDGSPTS